VPIVCEWEMLNMKGRPHGHAPQDSSQAIQRLASVKKIIITDFQLFFSYSITAPNCSKLFSINSLLVNGLRSFFLFFSERKKKIRLSIFPVHLDRGYSEYYSITFW